MTVPGRLRIKWVVLSLVVFVFAASAVFFLRGPYISNFFKKLVLSELEKATGRQVIADRMYVNVFPPFIEATGIKAFEEDGVRVFAAERVKAYMKVSGILRRRINIERIVVAEPYLWANRAQMEDMAGNIKKYTGGKKRRIIKVEVKAVTVSGGSLSFYDEKSNSVTTAEGIDSEIVLREFPEVDFSVAGIALSVKDWPVIKGRFIGAAVIKDDSIIFKRLTVNSDESSLIGSGSYSGEKGNFNVDLNLFVDTLKRVMGLKKPGQGTIKAKGTVTVPRDPMETSFDLKLSGDFYAETLMEILGADISPVSGMVSFEGSLGGKASSPKGTAKARLKKGNIFGVKVDELLCAVDYREGVLRFTKGKGKLYGGKAEASASISIPDVLPYSVDVRFFDVDSVKTAELIGLTWLGLSPGKVTGELRTSGTGFNPEGHVRYEAASITNSLPGIVRTVKGDYVMKDWGLSLSDFEIKTASSEMSMEGTVDIPSKTMNIRSALATTDVGELVKPYFVKKLGGVGNAAAVLRGGFDDPVLDIGFGLREGSLEGHMLGDVAGDVTYTKELLSVNSLKASYGESRHEMEGGVEYALDPGKRNYELLVYIKNADMNTALKMLQFDWPVRGAFDGLVSMKGNAPSYSGAVSFEDAEAYGLPGVSASFGFSYDNVVFALSDAVLRRGDSSAKLFGNVSTDGSFYFKTSSEKLFLKDLFAGKMPADYSVEVEAEGKGTLENPDIGLTAAFSSGRYGTADIGGGTLKASLKGKEAVCEMSVLDGRTTVKGKAYLMGEMPWSAEAEFKQGRYDFLISPFLKEIPEDLLLNVEGRAAFKGDKDDVSASVSLEKLNLNLFGQGFTNDSRVEVSVNNREMRINNFVMRSGTATMSASGMLKIGEFYDLSLNGGLSLAPLTGMSKKAAVVKGDADFTVAVKGEWESPSFIGDMTITEATLGLKSFPQRLTSINGRLAFENGKINIQRLSAKLGGGDIGVSGIVGLDGLDVKQVYLDMLLNNVTLTPMRDFVVNFGGDMLIRGTEESRYITGNVQINKARYRKDLDWQKWLLERRKEVPRAEAGWVQGTALNINLYGSDNIMIDNNIARAPVKIDLTVRGTVASPRIFGRVESSEGKVFFRNNKFRILNASADFSDPQRTDPFVDIAAETSIRGYHVWLNLEGRMEQLNMTLASDPPLDEVDILGLLTVGRFGENLRGLESGVGAAEATAFITGKMQDVVEERLKDITGLSRVRIAPYVSKKTGAVTSRITVSKTLMEERLFVTYSTAVGMAEDELLMELLLSKNMSLQGIRDERGTLGGDIKFRFNFK